MHWQVSYSGSVATVTMDVQTDRPMWEGRYELKSGSRLAVDIELNDVVQRMRFEHPEIKTVVVKSSQDKVFVLERTFLCWVHPHTHSKLTL